MLDSSREIRVPSPSPMRRLVLLVASPVVLLVGALAWTVVWIGDGVARWRSR